MDISPLTINFDHSVVRVFQVEDSTSISSQFTEIRCFEYVPLFNNLEWGWVKIMVFKGPCSFLYSTLLNPIPEAEANFFNYYSPKGGVLSAPPSNFGPKLSYNNFEDSFEKLLENQLGLFNE